MAPSGPYKLVTVNTAPDRAKRLIGRVVENVKEKYTIIHSGNADSTQPLPYLHFQPTPNHPHRHRRRAQGGRGMPAKRPGTYIHH